MSESLVLRTTVVQEILASLKLLTLVSETFSGGIFLRLYFSKNDMVSASFSFILLIISFLLWTHAQNSLPLLFSSLKMGIAMLLFHQ